MMALNTYGFHSEDCSSGGFVSGGTYTGSGWFRWVTVSMGWSRVILIGSTFLTPLTLSLEHLFIAWWRFRFMGVLPLILLEPILDIGDVLLLDAFKFVLNLVFKEIDSKTQSDFLKVLPTTNNALRLWVCWNLVDWSSPAGLLRPVLFLVFLWVVTLL
jgi:hypothetical protein